MSKPIYKLVLVKSLKEANYTMSEEERDALWKKVWDGIRKVGAKPCGPVYDCRWSNDEYRYFFIIEYPSIEAAMAETSNAEEAGLFRVMEDRTILGIAEEEGQVTTV